METAPVPPTAPVMMDTIAPPPSALCLQAPLTRLAALDAPQVPIADAAPTPALMPFALHGQSYRPISLADLRPGDIGFEVKGHGTTWRQNCISLGERVGGRGDDRVLHAFLVLEVHPEENCLITADGSDGSGILQVKLDFSGQPEEISGVDTHAHHVFVRMCDPDLAECMAQIGRNWTTGSLDSFSTPKAIVSPFRAEQLTWDGVRWLSFIAESAAVPRPLRRPDGSLAKMMCSELVCAIGAAAVLNMAWAEGRPRDAWSNLAALQCGHGGRTFACEPRALPPSALHLRLATNGAAEPVGYVPPRCWGLL